VKLPPRFLRGCHSILGIFLHPLGRFCGHFLKELRTPERLNRGLVLVLPGIEGESLLNHGIARGLADGGLPLAIEIHDWTTGVILFFLYHLRGWRRNVVQADRLVQRILEYRRMYPGRPVHLVGHSGGAAMAVLALERLPAGAFVTSAVLLHTAISPGYDLSGAIEHVEQGIWNFRSVLDVFFLGIGTCVTGTLDGCRTPSAGMLKFRPPAELPPTGRKQYDEKLHDVPFTPSMVAAFNLGGHFGPVNRVFVAEHVAPLLIGESS
jgi:pimeloyl-ACP methyl ester carboxylesterase